MLSTMLFGHFGNAAFEHKVMVRMGVANVLGGNALIVYVQCIYPVKATIMGGSEFFGLMAIFGLIIVSLHLLVFPFWARCCMTSAFVLGHVVRRMAGNHSNCSLGHEAELTLIIFAALAGEALGYLFQRSARNQYLERSNEREEYRMRNEQLQNEKERLDFERKMALKQMGVYAGEDPYDFLRAESSLFGTNSELADLCSHFEVHAEQTADNSSPHVANDSASHSVVECSSLGLRQRCVNAGTVPAPKVPTFVPLLNDERTEALWRTLKDARIELRGGSDRDSMCSSEVASERL